MPATALPNAEGGVDASKQALLNAITSYGQTGQVPFNAEAGRQQAAHQAAVAQIAASTGTGPGRGPAAPAALTSSLVGQQQALQNVYNMDRQMSQGNFGQTFGAIRAGNAAYMDQARAAVPAIRAQAEGQMAQIRADMEEARLAREEAAAARAHAAQMRQMDIQERLAANGGHDPADVEAIAKWTEDKRAGILGLALEDPTVITGTQIDPATGREVEVFAPISAAVVDIVDNAPDLESAIARVRAGYEDGESLEEYNRILDWVVSYYTLKDPAYRGQNATQKLADRLAESGLDPERYLPGYVPAGEQDDYAPPAPRRPQSSPGSAFVTPRGRRPTPFQAPSSGFRGTPTGPRAPNPDRGSVIDQIFNRIFG